MNYSTKSSQDKPALSPLDSELPVLDSYLGPKQPLSRWSQIRQIMREPIAEFAGIAVFVSLGTGVVCQITLSTNPAIASSPKGDFLSMNFGWAVGLAMGVWISGGISEGHVNPAITLAMATWRGFPWRKVPAYILAQVLGAMIGTAVTYGNYINAIDIVEGGHHIRTMATANLFVTNALDYLTSASCFFDEFAGTAILSLVVAVATDKHSMAPPKALLPLTLFLLLLGIGVAHGMQTSYALNPARDFGARLLLTFAGYGKQVYTYRNQYWLWCPIIAPFLGAQFGTGFYEIFLRQQDSADLSASSDTETATTRVRSSSV